MASTNVKPKVRVAGECLIADRTVWSYSGGRPLHLKWPKWVNHKWIRSAFYDLAHIKPQYLTFSQAFNLKIIGGTRQTFHDKLSAGLNLLTKPTSQFFPCHNFLEIATLIIDISTWLFDMRYHFKLLFLGTKFPAFLTWTSEIFSKPINVTVYI